MKTSVIEVHDMLSVLSVDGVEQRIGEVPGVESVTVNYAPDRQHVMHFNNARFHAVCPRFFILKASLRQ